MRDRDAYLREGRNDPLAPEQLREHPYDFVALPGHGPARGRAAGHDRYFADRLSGRLTLVYETVTPLHVGSGAFEAASECGLSGGRTPVRGIVRRQGRPILPGSGWKGAVRARFEAITDSRLCLVDTSSREPAFKVPADLQHGGGSHQVRITDPRVSKLRPLGMVRERDLEALPPAEALFGAMGYRGRLHPADGRIEGPAATEPLRVAPLDGPVMHRLARPGKARNAGGSRIEISEVEGRKFYYDGDVVHARQTQWQGMTKETHELVDSVPAGCTITIDVHLESLDLAELGALLVAAGHGEGVGVLRFGGYKPAGLGKVSLREARPELARGASSRRWRREKASAVDLTRAVEQARAQLINEQALDELHRVTTRRRP